MSALHLTPAQRRKLAAMRQGTTDLAIYRRVVGLLTLADGVPVTRLAKWLGVTRQSLYNWAERYFEEGRPSALESLPHPGRPPL